MSDELLQRVLEDRQQFFRCVRWRERDHEGACERLPSIPLIHTLTHIHTTTEPEPEKPKILPCALYINSRQALKDGELVTAGLPYLGPVEVVEDMADVLLQELLHEHALGEGGA